MVDWTHRYAKLSYPRRFELAPQSRLVLDPSTNERVARRIRVLLDADERRLRPRAPITLPPLKGGGGDRS